MLYHLDSADTPWKFHTQFRGNSALEYLEIPHTNVRNTLRKFRSNSTPKHNRNLNRNL